jgi:hypothetical protein
MSHACGYSRDSATGRGETLENPLRSEARQYADLATLANAKRAEFTEYSTRRLQDHGVGGRFDESIVLAGLYAGWTSGSRGHRDHERLDAQVALVITVPSRS